MFKSLAFIIPWNAGKVSKINVLRINQQTLFIGIIIANASVFWQLLLQLDTPAEMTGRVFGIATLIGEATLPIAYGITGILLGYLSISSVMLGSGACLMIIGVGILLSFRHYHTK